MKTGLLLLNLGTPNAPTLKEVARYLRQFLCDERVIDLPALVRYALVYGVILPFRTPRTVHAYQKIWTQEGSPLLLHSQALMSAVQKKLGSEMIVSLGMRYGHPSIQEALKPLESCEQIIILPLYPQYASASSGSSIQEALTHLSQRTRIPHIRVISSFFDHPSFIQAQASLIQPYLKQPFDFVLFSYHGLPERQIMRQGCTQPCRQPCPSTQAPHCYRAQCYATSQSLAQALKLNSGQFDTSFQSRLGRLPWIQPYTDRRLSELRQQGVQHLIIACPSFTADCLETLEELALQAQEQWLAEGGQSLTVVPCLNASPAWVEAILDLIQ